ncbi:hypothetical protein SLEP1_g25366 [Rubroshorea leprosula]|uniref:Uncharacterized protein n=1 Tax=Rubroshorea leprosula TaxID=152421 RepID=A0AAV5JW37_9ROSI|nr:hypothetical protein SLEP1_g25366 [Rubroshorea leprosula]
MADAPSSPATLDPSSQLPTPESGNPNQQPDPPSASATTPPPQESSTPLTSNSTSNAPLVPPQPPLITSYGPPPISGAMTAVLPAGPSFRPVPLFSPLQNYQLPGVPPPGVSAAPVVAPGSVPTPMMPYQVPPGQAPNPALRPFAHVPNGYAAIPGATVQGAMPLPGGLFHLSQSQFIHLFMCTLVCMEQSRLYLCFCNLVVCFFVVGF